MIPLTGFNLTNANNHYDLAFQLREDAELIKAPELSGEKGNRFSKTDDKGLPIFEGNGDRILYTQNEGLARLTLVGNFVLHAGGEDLVYSNANGRIVVVSDKAATDFSAPYSTKVRQTYEQRKSELSERFAKEQHNL